MNKIEFTLAELLNILVTAQKAIQNEKGKEIGLIAYSSGTKKKKGNKSKKAKEKIPKALGGVSKNKGKKNVENKGKGKYFYCQGEGHWKRNCPKFLESIKKRTRLEKVRLSLIYLFLNVLRVHLMHGYWIPVIFLTYVLPCRI